LQDESYEPSYSIIKQCLSNTNESATDWQLNKAQVQGEAPGESAAAWPRHALLHQPQHRHHLTNGFTTKWYSIDALSHPRCVCFVVIAVGCC